MLRSFFFMIYLQKKRKFPCETCEMKGRVNRHPITHFTLQLKPPRWVRNHWVMMEIYILSLRHRDTNSWEKPLIHKIFRFACGKAIGHVDWGSKLNCPACKFIVVVFFGGLKFHLGSWQSWRSNKILLFYDSSVDKNENFPWIRLNSCWEFYCASLGLPFCLS